MTLVSKRQDVTLGGYYNGKLYQSISSTTYYVTVECEDGERQEFRIKGRVYGLLAVGDKEQADRAVNVRRYGSKETETVALDSFVESILADIAQKSRPAN